MSELTPGTEFAGHRIDAVAGQGGMGVVYRATHLALDITVALKVIRPDLAKDEGFRERFKRESRAAASIDHPNVLPVRHAGEEDGLLYITMRHVEGTDLRALIDSRGRVNADHAVRVIGDIGGALDAAHASGLIHRDVKPANILLERDDGSGHAYLTDFGLTRHASSAAGLTKTGQWVGTLDYVAPEQIEGRQIDARADVYALGCVLYESLTGEVPFNEDSEVAVMYAHLNEPAPAPRKKVPDLPSEIDDVIDRALAKDPDDRFPSAGDLATAARAAIKGEAVAQPERSVAAGEAAPVADAPAAPGATKLSPSPATPPPPPPIPPPAVGETRAAGDSPPPPPGGTPPAPPPPPPKTAMRERGGFPKPLLAGLAALALIAIAVGGLLAAGLIVGSDEPPPPDEPTAEEPAATEEAAAQGTIDAFRTAFSADDETGVAALLAPDAPYRYLGFPERPATDEYEELFDSIDPKDYELNVDDLTHEAGSSPAVVNATLDYAYRVGSDRASGTLSWRLQRESETGDYKIAEITATPDFYLVFTIGTAPVDYESVLFGDGERVGSAEGTLEAEGDDVPIRIPVDPALATELTDTTALRAVTDFSDRTGRSSDSARPEFPYAS